MCVSLGKTPGNQYRCCVQHYADPGCSIPYTVYSISPPLGRFSKVDCSTTQERANTERYVFGKLSARWFQTPTFLAPTPLFQLLVEISSMEHRPRGVRFAPSCTANERALTRGCSCEHMQWTIHQYMPSTM